MPLALPSPDQIRRPSSRPAPLKPHRSRPAPVHPYSIPSAPPVPPLSPPCTAPHPNAAPPSTGSAICHPSPPSATEKRFFPSRAPGKKNSNCRHRRTWVNAMTWRVRIGGVGSDASFGRHAVEW
ncbi:hypothetical protein NL676_002720 [Syzygium grande]|nr:hypothetical protein NL676_002720 [Syzygium grande]